MAQLCPDQEMAALMESLGADAGNDPDAIRIKLLTYPDDPRLHFLLASLQVANKKHMEAHASFQRALDIAPDFIIARYQFGFFALTSGEADKALSIWGPLFRLPQDNYLRHFVEGMAHLIRDEFSEAIEDFESGMKLNHDNPPLNNDISILIGECHQLMAKSAGAGPSDEGDASSTSFLLGQMSRKTTKH